MEAVKEVKRNLQLCFLQMSQAIPLFSTCLLYFIATMWFQENDETQIFRSYVYHIVWGFWQYSDTISHFFHFYFYVIFSPSFRKAFVERIRHFKRV